MTEPVIKIDINMACMESNPCQHFCTLTYSTGEVIKRTLNARDIVVYWHLLSDNQRNHFAYART
jgi:hypothetical protein